MSDLFQHFRDAASKTDFANRYIQYLMELLQQLDPEKISQLMEIIEQTYENSRTIYLAANGGSAAIASHWANDLGFGIRRTDERFVNIVSLSDNVAVVTAIANDVGYDAIFIRQLQNALKVGDTLIVMSCSGNSPNIIQAVEYAKQLDVRTVGLTGFDGGRVKDMVDLSIHIETPKGEYGPVEDIFQIIDHIIYSYLRASWYGRLSH